MNYEDYKPFKMASVLVGATSLGITSTYDAARFLLEQWPQEYGPKARIAREILLKCLEGNCSAAVARVAFVEAAREASIYIETAPRPESTGGLGHKWNRKRTLARDRRTAKG